MRFKFALAALAATTAFATPAAAQVVSSTAQAEARGTILQPLTLSWAQAGEGDQVVEEGELVALEEESPF